ncbi:MAG: pyrroloquinoline quinone-dependent dehydrogenase [bacterium]|nr:pyrroloquinoline quinone-dependent dehydrogenase [bacterium]
MINGRWVLAALASAVVLASACSPDDDDGAEDGFAWDVYGGDAAHTKFAPLDQIHRRNVEDLEVVWRWRSPDEEILAAQPDLRTWAHESTPLAVDGVLYTATSFSQVVALDAGTGETLWVHDPETWKQGSPPNMGFLHRGVAYWPGVAGGRLFIGTGDAWLMALDPTTGEPVSGFGDGGRVDLTEGLGRPVDRDLYGVSSPPTICRDVVIVGSSISDDPIRPDMPPGDVRGFDPRTGKLLWSFQTIPEGIGNANVWTLMSCDEELGTVYLPTSTPTNDYYGGERPGDNLHAESLVALDAVTGEKRWHYQMVHHGLWDYDLPAAPVLVDLEVDGRPVKAVAQVSKQAFAYVLDRVTGESVWPIEERPVPASPVAGEHSSPTQPFPTRPPAFDRQGVSEGDLIDFTPELRAEAVDILDRFDYGPLYHPPSEVPSLVLPGPVGGASWAGAAFDPRSQTLYVPSVTKASLLMLVNGGERAPGHPHRGFVQLNPPGPQGLPLWKPPYGRVTAIDLGKGEISWTSAVGSGPRDHPALAGLDLPPLGWPRRSFVLLSGDVLFVAQQGKWRLGGMNEQGNAVLIENENAEPSLRALDPRNGRQIAEIPLPGNATGSPMTYLHDGRQYVVLAIGGGQLPAELVALGLPRGDG